MKQFSNSLDRLILCKIKTDNIPKYDPIFFKKNVRIVKFFWMWQNGLRGRLQFCSRLGHGQIRREQNCTQKIALKILNLIIENLNLIDIWRVQHPQLKRFTWRRRKPNIHCCLYFFLVSNTLGTNLIETDILPGYKTDHSLITLTLSTRSNPQGPGFWKFNKFILSDNY